MSYVTTPTNIVILTGIVSVHYNDAKTFTVASVDKATGLITTAETHGFNDGESVMLSVAADGKVPTGLTAWTEYFVRDTADKALKLAETKGGVAIVFTTDDKGFAVEAGFADLGEVDKFTVTGSASTKEKRSSRSPARGVVASSLDQSSAEVELNLCEFYADSLALVLGGTVSADGKTIALMQKPIRDVYLRVDGTNDHGTKVVAHVPSVAVSPSSAVGFITDDNWSGSVKGKVQLDTRFPGREYGWAKVA